MNTSQDSINEQFEDYRHEIQSIKSSEKELARGITQEYQKSRKKRNYDWGTRLRSLNKALRDKLKGLNEMLEKELDRVYIKSLNPKNAYRKQPDLSHQNKIADRELENAQKQYEQSLYKKKVMEKELRKTGDPEDLIGLEEKLRQLKNKKKALKKTITDLSFNGECIGKQIEKANKELEDPNEADNILYKLKVVRKKKEKLEITSQKHLEVMDKINTKISTAKQKVEREQRKVQEAEKRQFETAPKGGQNESLLDDTIDYSTNTEETEYQQYRKNLVELKRITKHKRLDLEKLFIELQERDKENRLLNLKVKELERMVPHNRLNPVRDKSFNVIRRRKRMKNSSIAEANNSVLVTKKDHRLKNLKMKQQEPEPEEKIKKVETLKKSISEVSKPEDPPEVFEQPKPMADDSKQSLSELSQENPEDTVVKPQDFRIRRRKASDESEDFQMGKGLNGEPSIVKVS